MGVQSRDVWQVVTGSLSAEVESSKTMENPHVSCFAPLLVPYFVAATVYNQQSQIKFMWTTAAVCGHCIYVSVLCVL